MDAAVFNLKFLAKVFKKKSARCEKNSQSEIAKMKKAIKAGNMEVARILASNAIRKKNESVNLLRLASRIDAASSRIETAAQMRQVTESMARVVGDMDRASQKMDLERMTKIMDKFESQSEDLDIQTEYMEGSMSGATALATPQGEIDMLMQQAADEAGLELSQELGIVRAPQEEPLPEEDGLNERLAKLRNTS
ncbi:hypothetical protein LPJ61_001775 [Coemansia biformis]|uniref:Vacuolar assembly protein DID2 n=1 Tax=Coemansia biformis TaxID=1286918 RepID=A0A9W7YE95_9FUNG|nr:hypothetical protein LPJ61_001775 [Coemansia biformis]